MGKGIARFFFESSVNRQRILLIAIACVCYIPFIGGVHLFDWDEINFAEISREMLITGDYFTSQIDFRPFYEKPPLFNWIQILSFKVFGINEFGARFPNAFFGIVTLLVLFEIGKLLRGAKFGMLWALLYLGALTPHFYFKTGIIDPVFNLFIFISVYFLFKVFFSGEGRYGWQRFALFSGIFNGLAVLTKGPVGLLILMLTIGVYVLLYKKCINKRLLKALFLCVFVVFLMTLVWILPQFLRGGLGFARTFTVYMVELLTQDVATHGQPFYYHFVVVFVGCFPISIIALRNVVSFQRKAHYDYTRWMFCLFWVVLLLFSIVKTKIVHYSSMTYMPLAYLAADVLVSDKKTFPKWLYAFLGLLLAALFCIAPFLLTDKTWLLSLAKNDAFAQDLIKALSLPIEISLVGAIFLVSVSFAYLLFRKGHVEKAVLLHTAGFALFFNLELATLFPSVERAVQGGAISFYKRFAGKDVYLVTLGFHSYGRVYYFEKTIEQAKYSQDELLSIPVDKPVYVVAKTNTLNGIDQNPNFKFVEKRGGYWLFVKK